MEEEGIDPSTVNRNPKLIKAAQDEISVMDVLVCGKCHFVFHFIQEFQEHKDQNECSLPVFKGSLSEPKPQVWAFLLWKSAQSKAEGEGGDQISSWKLYQKWCKMPENIREAWISAGKAIQVSTTLGSAIMQEVKSPVLKGPILKPAVVRKPIKGRPITAPSQPQADSSDKLSEKKEEDSKPDDSKTDESASKQENGSKATADGVEIKEELVIEEEAAFEDEDEEQEERLRRLEAGESIEDIDKSFQRSRQQPVPATILKKKTDGEAKMTPLLKTGAESEDEYVVERIVSRRYNIRKKAYEYLLKWEGYPDDQNTWEPAENLADCKHLLENFERNLAKQKQLQAQGKEILKKGPSGLPTGPKMITADVPNLITPKVEGSPSRGRPVRSSKKKAMDQVKAWCGSMSTKKLDDDGLRDGSDLSDDEDGIRKLKRSSESEDMSQYDGLSADELPMKRRRKEDEEFLSVRRGPGRPRKILKLNGDSPSSTPAKTDSGNQELAKTLLGEFISGLDGSSGKGPIVLGKKPDGTVVSPSQQPVLVANSKGVVKVDPRTMPNISSGVYIMSTKPGPNGGSGLVKIDSSNVKVVTGVGQKQGGIMAMKDTKGGESDGNAGGLSSPIKTRILGKKIEPITASSSSSPVTPMKLIPKLISPQMKGGLIKVNPSPRPAAPSTLSGLSGPRPLISPSVRPGLVRNTIASGPRPAIVSQRLPPLGVARGGIRPVRPKQALTVAGGRLVSSSLGPGVKSGIRPIEAMLGSSAQTSVPTSTTASPNSLSKDGKKESASILMSSNAAKLKQDALRGGIGGRGRGRGRGGRILGVGDMRNVDDKAKAVSGDGLNLDFSEDRSAESDSDSDCGLPDDFPTGDLLPIEPASPERPLTLCPLTGKILGRAEGEKTPPPTPPPEPVPSPQTTPPSSNTILLEEESLEGGEQTLIKVEMSPGGTTGTVVGDEGTTLLRTSSGLTVKRMSEGSSSRSGGLLSTVTSVANNQIQEISLPDHSEGQEIINPNSEMMTIQGPDGVVYQVQGQLEDGAQTLLVQDEDGEQRCVYVTTNQEGEDGSTVLTLDSAYADAVAQLDSSQVSILGDGSQLLVQNEDGTTTLGDSHAQLMSVLDGNDKDDGQAQIVAQVVQAGEAPPGGGPRNVVLLLPDGNLMVTEVDEEQYAALELEKTE